MGGIPEYVTKDSALLIDKDKNLVNNLADKINYLLKKSKDLWKLMGKEAKQNAKSHNTKMYYKRFCELLMGYWQKGKIKRMKIAILSMQRVINYGSVLQAYSLKEIIEVLQVNM